MLVDIYNNNITNYNLMYVCTIQSVYSVDKSTPVRGKVQTTVRVRRSRVIGDYRGYRRL